MDALTHVVVHTSPYEGANECDADDVDGVYGPFDQAEAARVASRMNEAEWGRADVWRLDGYPRR